MAPIFDVLVESGFQFTLSRTGAASDFAAPEELSNALRNMPGAAAAGKEDTLLSQLVQTCLLPAADADLSEGDERHAKRALNLPLAGSRVLTETYTYQGEKEVEGGGCAVFNYSSRLEDPEAPAGGPFDLSLRVANASGEVLFDREHSRVESADLKQTLDLLLKTQEQEVSGTLTQTTKVQRFDERPQDEAPPSKEPAEAAADRFE